MLPNSNELWKQWRKVGLYCVLVVTFLKLSVQMLHNGFHIRKAPVYHEIQSLESKVLLKQLMNDPQNFDGHLKRYDGIGTIFKILPDESPNAGLQRVWSWRQRMAEG